MKKELLGVKNNGFFSLYGLLLLNVIMSFCSFILCFSVTLVHSIGDSNFDSAEIYAIRKAINDLTNYKEKEETIYFNDYTIDFTYDDVTCIITIFQSARQLLKSELIFDDIELEVLSYTYLET